MVPYYATHIKVLYTKPESFAVFKIPTHIPFLLKYNTNV